VEFSSPGRIGLKVSLVMALLVLRNDTCTASKSIVRVSRTSQAHSHKHLWHLGAEIWQPGLHRAGKTVDRML